MTGVDHQESQIGISGDVQGRWIDFKAQNLLVVSGVHGIDIPFVSGFQKGFYHHISAEDTFFERTDNGYTFGLKKRGEVAFLGFTMRHLIIFLRIVEYLSPYESSGQIKICYFINIRAPANPMKTDEPAMSWFLS
jgi:hypothetical protein